MPIEILLLIGLILFASSFIKGITGFGTALFALPVLTMFFYTPEEARPIIITINLVLNIFILGKERKLNFENFNLLKPLILSGFIVAFISGFFLTRMDARLFNVLLGSLLIFTALNRLFGLNMIIPHARRYFIPVGAVGGILNTLVGAGGVPVLIFLSNTGMKKAEFRTTLLLFFLMLNLGSITTFIINDVYPIGTLTTVLFYTPFVILGSLVGMRVAHKINDQIFQRLIALLLLFMGINSIFGIL